MTPKQALDYYSYFNLQELCYRMGFTKKQALSVWDKAVWYYGVNKQKICMN